MYIAKFTTKNKVSIWPPSKEEKELTGQSRNQAAVSGIH
jgi:hypothetical protein